MGRSAKRGLHLKILHLWPFNFAMFRSCIWDCVDTQSLKIIPNPPQEGIYPTKATGVNKGAIINLGRAQIPPQCFAGEKRTEPECRF